MEGDPQITKVAKAYRIIQHHVILLRPFEHQESQTKILKTQYSKTLLS